jgi:hypothetical protein
MVRLFAITPASWFAAEAIQFSFSKRLLSAGFTLSALKRQLRWHYALLASLRQNAAASARLHTAALSAIRRLRRRLSATLLFSPLPVIATPRRLPIIYFAITSAIESASDTPSATLLLYADTTLKRHYSDIDIFISFSADIEFSAFIILITLIFAIAIFALMSRIAFMILTYFQPAAATPPRHIAEDDAAMMAFHSFAATPR